MVLQAARFGVLHPPGYPLLVVYNAFFVRLLPFLGPVVAVALGSIVLALLILAAVQALIRRLAPAVSIYLVLSLATAPLFWTYATTPEVFIGLQFFVVAFLWLWADPALYLKPWFVCVLALSMLHHHTIVILVPILLRAVWLHRSSVRSHAVAIVSGVICLAGYTLIFGMHPLDRFSWGWIDTPKALLDHFLRAEYGTFSLAASEGDSQLQERIVLVAQTLLRNNILPLLLISTGLTSAWKRLKRKHLFLAVLLIGYVVLFTVYGAIPLTLAGVEVYKRFLLLPTVMAHVFAAAFYFEADVADLRKPLRLLTAVVFVWNVWVGIEESSSGHRELAAHFAKDLLQGLPKDALVVIQGDSTFFISSYYQGVEGLRPDLAISPSTMLPWRHRKLSRDFPKALKPEYVSSKILELASFDVPYVEYGTQLRLPAGHGLEKLEFSHRYFPGPQRLIFHCDPHGPRYKGPDFPLARRQFTSSLSVNYGQCDFLKGLHQLDRGLIAEAVNSFETSLRKNPWLIQAQERLCHALTSLGRPSLECSKKLDQLVEGTDASYYVGRKLTVLPRKVDIVWE